jgi:hypothetical protein
MGFVLEKVALGQAVLRVLANYHIQMLHFLVHQTGLVQWAQLRPKYQVTPPHNPPPQSKRKLVQWMNNQYPLIY